MSKPRIKSLEKQAREKWTGSYVGSEKYPQPGFFTDSPDVEQKIEEWRADLLKQGYSLEAVNLTPAYIEDYEVDNECI